MACRQQPAGVEDVTAGAAREQGGEPSRSQLMRIEHVRRRCSERAHRAALGHDGRPQRHAEHEVDVELQVAGVARRCGVRELPLPARVLGRHPFGCQTVARADRVHCLLDLRALGEHRVAIRSADVVQVDVDGQPRHVEDEQVERRAALERNAPLEKRMRVQPVQQ